MPHYNWNDKTIMIVEDDYFNFKLLHFIIKSTKAQTIHCKNGKEAVDYFKYYSGVDLILMDIKMPEMDGHQATYEIRKRDGTVPIIAQTAYDTENEEEKCYENGCNDFIKKPIKKNDLLPLLNSYFAHTD